MGKGTDLAKDLFSINFQNSETSQGGVYVFEKRLTKSQKLNCTFHASKEQKSKDHFEDVLIGELRDKYGPGFGGIPVESTIIFISTLGPCKRCLSRIIMMANDLAGKRIKIKIKYQKLWILDKTNPNYENTEKHLTINMWNSELEAKAKYLLSRYELGEVSGVTQEPPILKWRLHIVEINSTQRSHFNAVFKLSLPQKIQALRKILDSEGDS